MPRSTLKRVPRSQLKVGEHYMLTRQRYGERHLDQEVRLVDLGPFAAAGPYSGGHKITIADGDDEIRLNAYRDTGTMVAVRPVNNYGTLSPYALPVSPARLVDLAAARAEIAADKQRRQDHKARVAQLRDRLDTLGIKGGPLSFTIGEVERLVDLAEKGRS